MKNTNDYRVIELLGKQYLVHQGDTVETNHLAEEVNKPFKIDKVLLAVTNGTVDLGEPYLKDRFVTATVIKHYRGDKIRIAKFKAKTGYRRVTGFRSLLSQIEIDKLN